MLKFILIAIFLTLSDTQSNYNDSWEMRLYNTNTSEFDLLIFDMSIGYATCDSGSVLIIVNEINNGRMGIVLPLDTMWDSRLDEIISKDLKVYYPSNIKNDE